MRGTVPVATDRRPATRAVDSLRFLASAAAQLHSAVTLAEARRRTDAVLRTLDPQKWQIASHVRLPEGGHLGHLVTGSSAVYLLDSRAWHGVVTVDQKGATITPDGNPCAAWTARGQHRSLPAAAAEMVRVLSAATERPLPPMRAVVVVWSPFPEGVAFSGGVSYVAGGELAGWLTGQPANLDHRPGSPPREVQGADAGPALLPRVRQRPDR